MMITNLEPDFNLAENFLTLLDEEAKTFQFQVFYDHKDGGAIKPQGSLKNCFQKLTQLNRQRRGIFITINETDGKGRKKENIVRIRAVFADDDNKRTGYREDWPLKPHIIVNSSEGKYHYYLLVDGLSLDEFEPIQMTIALNHGTDPQVKDLPRVLRLPGFYHQKGDPFLTRVVSASAEKPYTAEQIQKAFPVVGPTGIKSSAKSFQSVHVVDEPATEQEREIVVRVASQKAKRTCEDPSLSRHGELLGLGQHLYTDGIEVLKTELLEMTLDIFRGTNAGHRYDRKTVRHGQECRQKDCNRWIQFCLGEHDTAIHSYTGGDHP